MDTSPGEITRDAPLVKLSRRLGLLPRRLRVAVEAIECFEEPEFEIVKTLVKLVGTTPRSLEVRRELSSGLRQELEKLWTSRGDSDPLSDVDNELDVKGVAAVALSADVHAIENRARLLAGCVSSSEGGELTNRSRQAVERQRRAGQLLALRSGRQWCYPRWQFDVDGRGGLVPGLAAVLKRLRLSPYGAALWLTTRRRELGDKAPSELLSRGQAERVIELAEDHGHML